MKQKIVAKATPGTESLEALAGQIGFGVLNIYHIPNKGYFAAPIDDRPYVLLGKNVKQASESMNLAADEVITEDDFESRDLQELESPEEERALVSQAHREAQKRGRISELDLDWANEAVN